MRVISDKDDAPRRQLSEYWMYLFANFGVYCEREDLNNKKTPALLGLDLVTPAFLSTLIGRAQTPAEEQYCFGGIVRNMLTVYTRGAETPVQIFPGALCYFRNKIGLLLLKLQRKNEVARRQRC